MIFKKIFGFVFVLGFSLFLISCSNNNDFFKNVSLNSLSSISSLQGNYSESSNEEEPELRFSFQMTEPTAILPDDKIVKIGAQVLIDGAMSEGAISYRWNFDVFPSNSNAIINDPTASSISFTPDVPGLYLIKLVVRDADTNSKESYLSVRATEDNTPPNFRFSLISSKNDGFPRNVRFRLRDIVDDGKISFVEMNYGDGNKTMYYEKEIRSIGGNIEHWYLTAGDYEVKTTVVDDKGLRTTKSTTIKLDESDRIPSLKYSVNSTSGTAPFTLRVDASTSFDPDDDTPLHFFWDWDDDGAFSYTTDLISTHTYKKPGIYTVEAFVRDEGIEERYNYFTVYVDDPNNPGTYQAPAGGSPPVLNLKGSTNSFSGRAPLTINFDASQSFDLEGDDFEVSWEFYGFTFKRYEEGLKVTKTYDNPGMYYVRIVAKDSHGNERIKWMPVLVYDSFLGGQPKFSAYQDSSNPNDITFSVSERHLYGIPAQRFFWDLGTGDFSRRDYFHHTYSENGFYPVTLSTIDMFGNRNSVSKALTIDGQKHDIDANIIPFYEVAQLGQPVFFTGERSSSSVSGVLYFFWYLVTGTQKTISQYTYSHFRRSDVERFDYSYFKKGIYKNRLFVTNSHGLSADALNFIAVNSGEGPKANAKLSTYIGTAPLTVNFDGSYSKSPANITDYDWNIARRVKFSDPQVSYTYEEPREHYSDFFVKDSNGNFDANFYQVTVLDPDDVSPTNQKPTVQINTNQIEINDLEIDMASTITDLDGHIRYTEWDWGDGVIEVFRHHEDSPFHRYENYGSYTITVRAFDNMGAITTATHNITLAKPQTSQRSAGARGQGQKAQAQRVLIPKGRADRERFQEIERQRTGCYKKADGQMKCYYFEDITRGM